MLAPEPRRFLRGGRGLQGHCQKEGEFRQPPYEEHLSAPVGSQTGDALPQYSTLNASEGQRQPFEAHLGSCKGWSGISRYGLSRTPAPLYQTGQHQAALKQVLFDETLNLKEDYASWLPELLLQCCSSRSEDGSEGARTATAQDFSCSHIRAHGGAAP